MNSSHVHLTVLILLSLAATACQRDPASAIPEGAQAPADAAATPATAASMAEAPPPATASAKDRIGAVMDSFMSVKSYHAQMDASTPKGEMTMELDFVAPDRYRMKAPMGTQYVIGDTMFMTAHGRTMKVPLPAGQLTHYRDPASFAERRASMTVEDLGNDSVDGQDAVKYALRTTQPKPSQTMMWVGMQGYPLKLEVDSGDGAQATRMTIRYSRFNDPGIRIEPPQ